MKYFVVTTGAVLALLVGLTIPAQAQPQPQFECPKPIDLATTPQAKAEIQKLLPPGNATNDPDRLNASIDALSALGMSKAQIINHLIGAHCPTLAQNSTLSDAEKTSRMKRYASQITVLVYRVENVEEIILNVPLKPTVVDEVNAKAKKSGLSVEDWLSKVVGTAAEQP
jgi:hypothetical protein